MGLSLRNRPAKSVENAWSPSRSFREVYVSNVSNAGTLEVAETKSDCPAPPAPPVTQSKWFRLRKSCASLIRYLLDSEVHTYAFSVAANAIISFIPFVVLLYTLSLRIFHSRPDGPMVAVVNDIVDYFLPAATKDPEWVAKNIEAVAALSSRHGVQALSLV